MIKTYATFYHPGSFFPEETTREVVSRDVDALRPFPPSAFAVVFYDLVEGEIDGVEVSSIPRNYSKRVYIGGEVFTLDQLPDDDKHHRLRSNAECNGWPALIRCRTGNWQPFREGETVVPTNSVGEES